MSYIIKYNIIIVLYNWIPPPPPGDGAPGPVPGPGHVVSGGGHGAPEDALRAAASPRHRTRPRAGRAHHPGTPFRKGGPRPSELVDGNDNGDNDNGDNSNGNNGNGNSSRRTSPVGFRWRFHEQVSHQGRSSNEEVSTIGLRGGLAGRAGFHLRRGGHGLGALVLARLARLERRLVGLARLERRLVGLARLERRLVGFLRLERRLGRLVGLLRLERRLGRLVGLLRLGRRLGRLPCRL